MRPTVGVVIPVYRCAPYVRGCLESVLAQTFPVDEIVLVDDRGGDESVPLAQRVLAEHGRPHTLIRQPRNGGLGRARNTGLAQLATDLVWFLDSDDQADPDFVERLVDAIERHDAAFAVTRTRRVDVDGNVLQIDEAPPSAEVLTGERYAREILCGRAKAYACTKIFRREILGTHPWAQDQAYEDVATSVRLALSVDRVATVAEPLYRYLYREGSLSTALSPSTLDLFRVEADVRELICGADRGVDWSRDFVGFRYREVLTSVAHVAMRSAHHGRAEPPLYRTAIRRVRAEITMRDLPTLWAGRHLREARFAVLMKFAPGLYSAVLRWR
ncbi:glycosyltransferase family 2 protein [Gordonia polyisoprenivorans]|uniref:glycosyltransferase family 2 protein n=1 Tax=Gordonia polyisoprenivorans TaxID=84595 RepID=UPI0003679477|nr:glycosyltransferase family 2 protein [Gordonia polyisoprenivorans]